MGIRNKHEKSDAHRLARPHLMEMIFTRMFFRTSDDGSSMRHWLNDLTACSLDQILRFQSENHGWSKEFRRKANALGEQPLGQEREPRGLFCGPQIDRRRRGRVPTCAPTSSRRRSLSARRLGQPIRIDRRRRFEVNDQFQNAIYSRAA